MGAKDAKGTAAIQAVLQGYLADPLTGVGKYLQVFKRQADGSFRIAYDCFNSDLPG